MSESRFHLITPEELDAMPEEFIAPIVGMSFRPPSAAILHALPFETPLLLLREPTNEYDSNAIKVLLPGFSPDGPHSELFKDCLAVAVPDDRAITKGEWNACSLTDPFMLGYIKATDGPAAAIAAILDAQGTPSLEAKLSSTETGQPAATFFLEPTTEPSP